MQIDTFTLGPFETNCYVVRAARPEGGAGAFVVDASFDPAPIIGALADLPAGPEAIVLTHAHVDHIAGLGELKRAWPRCPVYLHLAERDWPADPLLNLSALTGMSVSAPAVDRLLEGGERLELPGGPWAVLHTPGHSPGGIGIYQADAGVLIAGDTLFAGSVGRTDFPGSDARTLARSIREKLYTLPDATQVLPGHGPRTSIGQEKRSNPFVRA